MMKHITYKVLGVAIGLILTPHAFAGFAPLVATNNVSGIGQTSATLWGVIDAGGVPATFWFEYGTTYSLGARSEMQQFLGSSRSSISSYVVGFRPNTTYYYRVVAQNGFGVATGDIQKFDTAWSSGVSQTTPVVTTPKPLQTITATKKPIQTVVVATTTAVAVAPVATTTATTATTTKQGSFLANAWSTIANIPGYIWFFLFLLFAILFVTYTFFRMLRGRATGEDDGHGEPHEAEHEEH